MGFFDDALKNAVPGGDLTRPLIIAAGTLLLGKMLGGGREPEPQSAGAPQPSAGSEEGGLLEGLGGLLRKLQQAGQGDVANSWVGRGENAPIQPTQLGPALGQQTVSDLARQAGISEQDLLAQLSKALPGLVDKLTPNGRLPTQDEIIGGTRH
jgi:uncharacterized protein YidB (DUF937 family)